ncbi:MAG: hypothetical protein R3E79_39160 [Caldilineaceae bacterium]
MSTYSIPTLLRLWRHNEATVEQAMGHALQHIAGLTDRLTAVEKRLRHLEQASSTGVTHALPQDTSKPQA